MSMKEVIPIANQLQELLVNIEGCSSKDDSLYELPQIAVIGNQSVGKSSVLEALMGVSCLPRGNGMVTKCPLILQLKSATLEEIRSFFSSHQLPHKDDQGKEHRCYVQFGHLPKEVFTQEESIKNEIVRRTNELCGGVENAISQRAIILKLSSADAIDLTLIDLPGVIRVPTASQPADLDEQIRKLVMQYVKSPKCIILAVSAANVDLANSDSLRIAREVDPHGHRTIGVLTKTDLIDDPTIIVNILEGRLYPLRRGYVPVKCRASSKSTQSLRSALEEEIEFFRTNPILKDYSTRCGTRHLAGRLNECLFISIKQFLPTLKSKIETALSELETKAQLLGQPIDPKDPAVGALLLDVFTRYSRTIDDLLDGRATTLVMDELSSSESSVELVGGARLHYIFHDWFASCVMKLDPLAGLSDKEIRTAIRNASGFSTSLFVPENAFEMLVKKQIQKLEQPACQCVYQARQEMISLIEVPLKRIPEFHRFTALQEQVRKIARKVVDDHLNKTSQTVSNFIQIELAFVNKSHPDFISGKKAISNYLIATAGAASKADEANGGLREQTSVENAGGAAAAGTNAAVLLSSRPVPVTPTTGVNSEVSDPESASQTSGTSQLYQHLTFWRRQPLTQQTPAALPAQSTRRPTRPQQQSSPLSLPAANPDFYQSDSQHERDSLEVDLVKVLITSYFNIVKKTLADIVPKTIMHLLVNASNKSLHGRLVTTLYKQELFEELLKENANVPKEREEIDARLKTLRRAHEILTSIKKSLVPRSPH